MALATSPPWAGRASGHTFYGGHVNKRNYGGQGVVNPETDTDADHLKRMATDLAAVARTAPFAVITLTMNDTATAAPTINACSLMTGITASYEGDAAPTGFPSGARNGDGHITLTFASSYNDDYGTAGAFEIRHAKGRPHGTTFANVVCDETTTTVVVRVFDAAGAAETDRKITVEVW